MAGKSKIDKALESGDIRATQRTSRL